MNIAAALIHYLESLGLSHVFGVSGANIEPLFFEMHRSGAVMPVLAKHEASAVTMAEGYFRRTGRIGAAMVTSGGGALNTLAPLAEALASGIPLLVLVGQIPQSLEGRGGFQDSSGQGTAIDSEAIFAPVTVAVRKLRCAFELADHLRSLVKAALSERGPAVLLIPRNLFGETAIGDDFTRVAETPHVPEIPEPQVIERIASLLRQARRPVVIGGPEVQFAGFRAVFERFIDALGARVVLAPDAKGLYDHQAPNFAGLVGVMGHESALTAIREADVVCALGTTLPLMSRPVATALADKTLISIHRLPTLVRASEAENLTIHELVGNPAACLAILTASLGEPRPAPRPVLLSFRDASAEPAADSGMLAMRPAIELLAGEFGMSSDLFVDAGNIGAAAIHYYLHRGRTVFSVALGMGGMGHSFGCAIGAAFASGQPGLVLAGDGAFYMCGLEIHTAWQYQLPVTFVIFNNNAHAMCHVREAIYLGEPSGDNLFRPSAIGAAMAVMLPGLPSFDITSAAELTCALRKIRGLSGPKVLVVRTSAEEIPPFGPFLSEQPTRRIQACLPHKTNPSPKSRASAASRRPLATR